MKKLTLTAVAISSLWQVSNADDIEIYTGAGGSGSSNILFVLDTSGSMSAWGNVNTDGSTAVEAPPYDPTVDYSTERYGFDPEAYYVFDSGEFRGGGDYLRDLTNYEVSQIKKYEINPSVLNCSRPDVQQRLESDGVVTDQFAFFKQGEGWSGPRRRDSIMNTSSPSVNKAASSILQCRENDFYLHNGQSYLYVANQGYFNRFNQPYTDDRTYPERFLFFTIRQDARYDWSTRGDGFYNIIWTGNYLNYMGAPFGDASSTPQMRLDMVRDAAKKVIETTTAPNVNFALMRFDANSSGGFVSIPMTPVSELRDTFSDEVDSYDPLGGTPLTESLYEAYNYLSGSSVDYGDSSISATYTGNINRDPVTGMIRDTNYTTRNTYSAAESMSGSRYKAPDFSGCTPKTKIILFSDGEPTGDDESNSDIRNLFSRVGFDPQPYLSTSCSGDGGCAEELAYVMANTDHRSDVDLVQNITVDTMGGFLSAGSNAEQKLKDIAAAGGGTYYPVDTEESIELGLRNAMSGVIDEPTSFTSATVAINSFNSLETSDQVYYSVFAPASSQKWLGNLKRYRVGSDGEIYDAENVKAVDPETGYFSATSKSFWSQNIDGIRVDRGGAASRLGETPRNIFTTVDGAMVKLDNASATVSNELLGLGDITDPTALVQTRTELMNWIMGINPDGSVRKGMEDPLHSQPVVVNYEPGKSVIFIATNSGYLHAFKADDTYPEELFAVVPKELLQNARPYMEEGSFNAFDKVYGLDGTISFYHKDNNTDGKVNYDDKVYLYVGMRRGGHSYYAFDVTNPVDPKLAWQVNGPYANPVGKNVPDVTTGFESLGQTWSAMKPALVRWKGERRVVLFFGGGYDPAEDGTDINGPETRMENVIGNSVYMVDAESGELLWDARKQTQGLTSTNMSNAFPSNVIPIDRDRNGFIDMLYASDVGGRLWRFDFNESSENSSDFARGGAIFDINQPSSETGNRRFFTSPDVSLYSPEGKVEILLSIGSGYRAHPLSTTTTDYHFVLRDKDGMNVPSAYETIKFNDLKSWGTAIADASHGWYVPLTQDYEKVLSEARLADGIVYFTTYAPQNLDDPDLCEGDTGVSRVYLLDTLDPSGDRLTELGVEVEDGRGTIELPDTGILPPPVLVFPNPEDEKDDNDDDNSYPNEDQPDGPGGVGGVSGSCNDAQDQSAVALIGPVAFATLLSQCERVSKTYWREE